MQKSYDQIDQQVLYTVARHPERMFILPPECKAPDIVYVSRMPEHVQRLLGSSVSTRIVRLKDARDVCLAFTSSRDGNVLMSHNVYGSELVRDDACGNVVMFAL